MDNAVRRVRVLLSWEFWDGTAFQLVTSAPTEETLNMLDQLIRIKREELNKLQKATP